MIDTHTDLSEMIQGNADGGGKVARSQIDVMDRFSRRSRTR